MLSEGLLVHLSSWQVETQHSQDVEALLRSTQPCHILYPHLAIHEVTQAKTSILTRSGASPVVSKAKYKGTTPVPFLTRVTESFSVTSGWALAAQDLCIKLGSLYPQDCVDVSL